MNRKALDRFLNTLVSAVQMDGRTVKVLDDEKIWDADPSACLAAVQKLLSQRQPIRAALIDVARDTGADIPLAGNGYWRRIAFADNSGALREYITSDETLAHLRVRSLHEVHYVTVVSAVQGGQRLEGWRAYDSERAAVAAANRMVNAATCPTAAQAIEVRVPYLTPEAMLLRGPQTLAAQMTSAVIRAAIDGRCEGITRDLGGASTGDYQDAVDALPGAA